MPKSIKYDAISGFEGTEYVFEFKNDLDGQLKLIGIWKDGSIMDPELKEWTTISESDECSSAWSILVNGYA